MLAGGLYIKVAVAAYTFGCMLARPNARIVQTTTTTISRRRRSHTTRQ